MPTITGLTIEEFEQLPDALAHNHELVDGELVDVSGNTGGHNSLRDAVNDPPAEPGAFINREPLKAASGVANAAPMTGEPLKRLLRGR
jgi:hypothetical protein